MTSLANASIFQEMVGTSCAVKQKNIFRTTHDRENPYTLITNKLLRDTTIKHSDRGLMCQLLSWSDFHNLCIQAIVKKSLEGRDAIRGSIDRLIQAGYIRMVRLKNELGQFDRTVYQIFEQSTGHVVADLDLSGIDENNDVEYSPQLNLFGEEDVECVVTEDRNLDQNLQAVVGFSVSGKHDTNNNYELRNTENNSNNGKSIVEILQAEQVKTQAELLNTWYLDIKDPLLIARVGMAGLSTYLTSQDQLNRFLIDFNQQHEKYKHLNHTQRLKNFIVYVLKMKATPREHLNHVLRLNALGCQIAIPSKPKRDKNDRLEQQKTGCNPFTVQQQPPVSFIADFLADIEGF